MGVKFPDLLLNSDGVYPALLNSEDQKGVDAARQFRGGSIAFPYATVINTIFKIMQSLLSNITQSASNAANCACQIICPRL